MAKEPSGGYHAAQQPPAQNAPPSRSIEFAETAPPLVDADLDRPIPDRGAIQSRAARSRVDPDAADARMTHNPPESILPNRPPEPSGLDPLSVPHDAPRVLTGFLVTYEGNALGQSWNVQQGANLVGRLGAVAGADIELPHATVSSRHATIHAAAHPGRMVLKDQGSTNGSFVNDTALQPDEQRELRDGDRVRFGLFTVIVKIV